VIVGAGGTKAVLSSYDADADKPAVLRESSAP
jgi:hypothetical protein